MLEPSLAIALQHYVRAYRGQRPRMCVSVRGRGPARVREGKQTELRGPCELFVSLIHGRFRA